MSCRRHKFRRFSKAVLALTFRDETSDRCDQAPEVHDVIDYFELIPQRVSAGSLEGPKHIPYLETSMAEGSQSALNCLCIVSQPVKISAAWEEFKLHRLLAYAF